MNPKEAIESLHFKIGDWVKCVLKYKGGYQKLFIGKVVVISPSMRAHLVNGAEEVHWVPVDDCVLSSEEEYLISEMSK